MLQKTIMTAITTKPLRFVFKQNCARQFQCLSDFSKGEFGSKVQKLILTLTPLCKDTYSRDSYQAQGCHNYYKTALF